MISRIVNNMRYGKMENTLSHSNYIDFKKSSDAEVWGNNHYLEWSQQYKDNMEVFRRSIATSCMYCVVECYCGYNYQQINEYLRLGIEKTETYLYREMADILAIVLAMAPRVPDDIIAYRLVCDEFIDKLISNNKNGIPTIEKGFISTSLTKDIINSTDNYSSHKNMLKIFVKANTIGIYVNGIAKRSEQELLLYPNGYFKLLKKPYKEDTKTIYECELIYF